VRFENAGAGVDLDARREERVQVEQKSEDFTAVIADHVFAAES